MTAAVLLSALASLAAADLDVREANPLAPSLPRLTKEEQAQINKVINRFIEAEVGERPAKEVAEAAAALRGLGPEATFQLIEGLNRAANFENSCPAVVIARKLGLILSATEDVDLLDFARENIGSGVTARRHMVVIKDLRLACALRKGAIQRRNLVLGYRAGQKTPVQMTVKELAFAAGSQRGPRLKVVLVELEKRRGEPVLNALGAAAESYEKDVQKLARSLLTRHLSRSNARELREALKSDHVPVRAAAVKVVGSKKLPLGTELIGLLNDREPAVQQAARQALVQLSKGRDYGPEPTAGASERAEATRRWQSWWATQADHGKGAP
jgi:hypothetical protein